MRRAMIISAISVLAILLSVGEIHVPAQVTKESYDWTAATAESFWYAVYNLRALLASGMGISLAIPEELLARFSQQTGLPRQSPLMSEAWIAVPYASGDPAYVQSGSQKWAEDKADRTVTSEAVAWMILSSSSQAKQLEQLYQRGVAATGETRLWATLLGYLAAEAAHFAYAHLRDPETQLYVRAWKENVGVSDPSLRPIDQIWMLWALAELNSLTQGFSFYEGTLSHLDVESRSVELFRAAMGYHTTHPNWLTLSTHDTGMLVESVSAYAAALTNGATLEEAVDVIQSSAQALKEQLKRSVSPATNEMSLVTDLAETIRALIIAQRMTGDPSLRQAALEGWSLLQTFWDATAGTYRFQEFTGTSRQVRQAPQDFTLRDVGAIVGAFAAVIHGAGIPDAKERYAQFVHGTLKAAKWMMAEGEEAGGSEDNDGVPAPGQAGGEFGRAPVLASSLQYDPGTRSWFVMNNRFDTAGALYVASRLFWIGQRDGQPFLGPPRWGLSESKETQFISLRKQVARLGEDRTLSEDVEAIRQLLIALESRFEDLRRQEALASILAQDLKGLTGRLDGLEQRVKSELSGLKQQVDRLEGVILAPPERVPTRFGLPDALTVVLILFILLLGFIAYQRVWQQPA